MLWGNLQHAWIIAQPQKSLLPYILPWRPWKVVSANIFMINNKMLLCIIEFYSTVGSLAVKDLVQLTKMILEKYGLPKKVISDAGMSFMREVLTILEADEHTPVNNIFLWWLEQWSSQSMDKTSEMHNHKLPGYLSRCQSCSNRDMINTHRCSPSWSCHIAVQQTNERPSTSNA